MACSSLCTAADCAALKAEIDALKTELNALKNDLNDHKSTPMTSAHPMGDIVGFLCGLFPGLCQSDDYVTHPELQTAFETLLNTINGIKITLQNEIDNKVDKYSGLSIGGSVVGNSLTLTISGSQLSSGTCSITLPTVDLSNYVTKPEFNNHVNQPIPTAHSFDDSDYVKKPEFNILAVAFAYHISLSIPDAHSIDLSNYVTKPEFNILAVAFAYHISLDIPQAHNYEPPPYPTVDLSDYVKKNSGIDIELTLSNSLLSVNITCDLGNDLSSVELILSDNDMTCDITKIENDINNLVNIINNINVNPVVNLPDINFNPVIDISPYLDFNANFQALALALANLSVELQLVLNAIAHIDINPIVNFNPSINVPDINFNPTIDFNPIINPVIDLPEITLPDFLKDTLQTSIVPISLFNSCESGNYSSAVTTFKGLEALVTNLFDQLAAIRAIECKINESNFTQPYQSKRVYPKDTYLSIDWYVPGTKSRYHDRQVLEPNLSLDYDNIWSQLKELTWNSGNLHCCVPTKDYDTPIVTGYFATETDAINILGFLKGLSTLPVVSDADWLRINKGASKMNITGNKSKVWRLTCYSISQETILFQYRRGTGKII